MAHSGHQDQPSSLPPPVTYQAQDPSQTQYSQTTTNQRAQPGAERNSSSQGSSEETRTNDQDYSKMEKGHQNPVDTEGVSAEYAALLKFISESSVAKKSDADESGETSAKKRIWYMPWKTVNVRYDRTGNVIKDSGARVTPSDWSVSLQDDARS